MVYFANAYIKEGVDKGEAWKKANAELKDEMDKVRKSTKDLSESVKEYGNSAGDSGKKTDALSANLDKASKTANTFGSVLRTAFTVSAAAITAVSGVIATVAGLGVKYNMQMEDSLMSFTTLLGSQEKAIAIAAETQKAAAGESVKTFSDMITDAKNRAASLGNLIKEIENTKIPDIKTGNVSAGAKAGAKEIKDAFAEAKLAIEDYKTTSDYTIEGEIEKWKQLGEKYKQGSKERVEINKTINQLEEKLSKDTYDKKIQDIERHREAVGHATEEELAMWEEALNEYSENSDEYNAINKKVNQVKKELAKDSFEHSKKWIDEY